MHSSSNRKQSGPTNASEERGSSTESLASEILAMRRAAVRLGRLRLLRLRHEIQRGIFRGALLVWLGSLLWVGSATAVVLCLVGLSELLAHYAELAPGLGPLLFGLLLLGLMIGVPVLVHRLASARWLRRRLAEFENPPETREEEEDAA